MNENILWDIHRSQGMSVRAANLLVKHRIDTAGKLICLTDGEMRLWRGCGKKTTTEIRAYADRTMEEVRQRFRLLTEECMADFFVFGKSMNDCVKKVRQLEELVG